MLFVGRCKDGSPSSIITIRTIELDSWRPSFTMHHQTTTSSKSSAIQNHEWITSMIWWYLWSCYEQCQKVERHIWLETYFLGTEHGTRKISQNSNSSLNSTTTWNVRPQRSCATMVNSSAISQISVAIGGGRLKQGQSLTTCSPRPYDARIQKWCFSLVLNETAPANQPQRSYRRHGDLSICPFTIGTRFDLLQYQEWLLASVCLSHQSVQPISSFMVLPSKRGAYISCPDQQKHQERCVTGYKSCLYLDSNLLFSASLYITIFIQSYRRNFC